MIIIEGPDGAGKTTLAQRLANNFGLRVKDWKINREELYRNDPRGRTYQSLCDALAPQSPVVVHDRLFFSELVYGSILRGKVAFSDREQGFILDVLKAMKVPIFICLPSKGDVIASVRKEAEHHQVMAGVVENIENIWDAYQEMLMFLNHKEMNYRLWDYTSQHTRELIWQDIEQYLDFRRERSY